MKLDLHTDKKVYFASDFHLGTPSPDESLIREKKIINWLEKISSDAQYIFLLGDLFDFWFEYSKVIPKGFVRFQGKLAELCDRGIQIHIFPGNHDMWMFNYFQKELGVKIHHTPISFEIGETKFHVGHGDGLGPGDNGYKFILKVFRSPIAQWLFKILPPVIGIGFAQKWSASSRLSNISKGEEFKGKDKEYLYQYSDLTEKTKHHDFYIFGHRHLLLDIEISPNSRYINLGEWVTDSNYASFDGNDFLLLKA